MAEVQKPNKQILNSSEKKNLAISEEKTNEVTKIAMKRCDQFEKYSIITMHILAVTVIARALPN